MLKHNKNINLDLYITHGLFSKGTDSLFEKFRNIITTDTILHDSLDAKVQVIPIIGER